MKFTWLILCMLVVALFSTFAWGGDIPAFVKECQMYQAFPGGFEKWSQVVDSKKDGERLIEWDGGGGDRIFLIYREIGPSTEEGVYQTFANRLNESMNARGGNVLADMKYFAVATVSETPSRQSLNVLYATQGGVYLWKYLYTASEAGSQMVKYFADRIILGARRHQFEMVYLDNVIAGRWAGQIREYAKLLAAGKDDKTLAVYRRLLEVSPGNVEAHLEFAALADDLASRLESAAIVLRLAEDEVLLNAAAEIAGATRPSLESVPTLGENDDGLKVVLIPLADCNPWLLEEVAKTYEMITTIPVVIRKPPDNWKLPPADRSVHRRTLEQIASRIWPTDPSYKDWPLEKLKSNILEMARKEGQDAESGIRSLFYKMAEDGGQWKAEPIMSWLSYTTLKYRTADPRTMVVGVTGKDIYSGDANFVFSTYGGLAASPVSILSYARMTAKFNGQSQSRARLVERIAKELVPASLKRLGIPRSVDPSCPYSYSDGVARLDEKTLVLSEPVRRAIAKYQR